MKRNPFVLAGVVVFYYVVTWYLVTSGQLSLWENFHVGGFILLNLAPLVGAVTVIGSGQRIAIGIAWVAVLVGAPVLGMLLL